MINVAEHVVPQQNELAGLVHEHLDDLATYATHLVGRSSDAIAYVAAGIDHAKKYPPTKLHVDGRAALYRAVTRACSKEQRFPPRPRGISRLFNQQPKSLRISIDGEAAMHMNTVKRALMTRPFEERAVLLLSSYAHLVYKEIAQVLECSPEAAARLLARARREFGAVYREIGI